MALKEPEAMMKIFDIYSRAKHDWWRIKMQKSMDPIIGYDNHHIKM